MSVTLPGNVQMILGLYGYLLPLLLYVLWSTLSLWDLSRRDDLPAAAVWAWPLLIFIMPFIGALSYLLFGGSRLLPRAKALVLGGGLAYLLVLALGASIGGIT